MGPFLVPKLIEGISSDMILFVSSKQRRLQGRSFGLILLFPSQQMRRLALRNNLVGILGMAFRAEKFSGVSRNGTLGLKSGSVVQFI